VIGDKDADAPLDARFRAVFEAEFAYVCRSLRRCGIRDADIEDLTHDVFLAAHVRFGDFDTSRPVKPWLFGIAFRIASHHKRRAGYRREETGGDLEPPDPAPGADVQLEAKEQRRLLIEALDTLDDDRRAVVVMHDLDGIPMQQIASDLSVPLFTGYSRLRTARLELAAFVRRQKLRHASMRNESRHGGEP
jgi:RNA polymerase sigma-70 factor, ECF subfamily